MRIYDWEGDEATNRLRTLFALLLAFMLASTLSISYAAPPYDILRPNSDVYNAGFWRYPESGDYFDKVDEEVADLTTYLYSAMYGAIYVGGFVAVFGLQDLSGSGYVITGVTVFVAARTRYVATKFQIKLWMPGSDYTDTNSGVGSGDITLTSFDFSTYSHNWAINPFTGLAWTIADVNNLQVGFNVTELPDNPAVPIGQVYTQVYVQVNEEQLPELVVPEAPLGTIALASSMILAFSAVTLYKRARRPKQQSSPLKK